MKIHDPMPMEKVRTDISTHLSVNLNQEWSDVEKLRWHAGAILVRTGLRIAVTSECATIDGHPQDLYGCSLGTMGIGPMTYHDLWTFMFGVEMGFQQSRGND